MARDRLVTHVDYNYLYRQGGLVADKPSELKAKPARRVITNLTVEDLSPEREPPLYKDENAVRVFFVTVGETVTLKRCPACRNVYDPERTHWCDYD